MGLNKRQMNFIIMLLNIKEYTSMSILSEELGVTTRTLSNDLKKIYEKYPSFESKLSRVPSKGLRFEGSDKDKNNILNILNENMNNKISVTDRRKKIITDLLVNEKSVTYKELSEKFYVSKSSIADDIEWINEWLSHQYMDLISDHNGTRLYGDEEAYQKTLKNWIIDYLDTLSIQNNSILNDEVEEVLSEFFPLSLIESVSNNLIDIHGWEKIPLHYQKSLFLTILIFYWRLSQGNRIKQDRQLLVEKMEDLRTYLIAENFMKRMQSEYGIYYSIADINKLNRYFLLYGFEPTTAGNISENLKNTINKLIVDISKLVNVDLTNDNVLFDSLIDHIKPMLYRLRYKEHVSNPLLLEIKKHFPVLFFSIWYAISNFEQRMEVSLTEDEVGFLVVHFQTAIAKRKKTNIILVVTNGNSAANQIIENQISSILPSKDLVELISRKDLNIKSLEQVDLIITFIELDIQSVPIVKVTPLLTDEDLLKIADSYRNNILKREKKTIDELQLTHFPKFLYKDFIFTNILAESKDEIISHVVDEMIEKKFVLPEYKNSLFAREEVSSTAFENQTAIPHGSPQTVLKSVVSIISLKKPIEWDDVDVQVIFVIAISNEDGNYVSGLMSEIYGIIRDKSLVKQIFVDKDNMEILNALCR